MSEIKTTVGAELIATQLFSFKAGHWFQVFLYYGEEVVPGSGGRDIYDFPGKFHINQRVTATGRRRTHTAGAAFVRETWNPAALPVPPCSPAVLNLPPGDSIFQGSELPRGVFQNLALGLVSNLPMDPRALSHFFSLRLYVNGYVFPLNLEWFCGGIFYERKGMFQILINPWGTEEDRG
jgi:hypothetical protein